VKSSVSIDIAAPSDLVFRLASDPLRWPALLPHYVRARGISSEADGSVIATYVARRDFVPAMGIGIPVAWRSRSWSERESCRLRFRHLGGATNGMEVTWHIEPSPGGCRVTIEHDFRPRLGAWATLTERAFVRPIATRTLATFKTLAEAVTDAAESGQAPATK
jgi:aromatase